MEKPTVSAPNVHANGFGALRLLFASLVIISHSFEMIDGDRSREPLHRIFGTMTFGGVAVDAFFLISGFLIAGSFMSNPRTYFQKRVLRIFPAFLICSILCVVVVAPLAGADLRAMSVGEWARFGYRLIMLKQPEIPGVFEGLPYRALNGSMWTISYEFRCYILAALFGILQLYRHRWIYLALTAVMFIATVTFDGGLVLKFPSALESLVGDPSNNARLLAAFMCGTCFRLFQVPLRGIAAAVAAVMLMLTLFIPPLAEAALIGLGAYVLFWVAFDVTWGPLRTINAEDDISYGVYLYAWPLGALILWYWRDVPPPVLIVATLVGAVVCGALSWRVIEKPAMALRPRQSQERPNSGRIDA